MPGQELYRWSEAVIFPGSLNYCLNLPPKLFGQNIPMAQQMPFRHLLMEHELFVVEKGETFRGEIIRR